MSNRKGEIDNGPLRVDVEQSHRISELTIAHYDQLAEAFRDGTRDHDVNWKSQQRPSRSAAVAAPWPCHEGSGCWRENAVIRLLFNIEPHALCERKLRPEIDRVGGATHVGFPRNGAGLATPPVSFSPPKAPPISAPEGPMFTLAMPQSESVVETNLSASRMSSVKDGGGELHALVGLCCPGRARVHR